MSLRLSITRAAAVADHKSPLPILGTVRIAGGRITACNLEQQIDLPADLPPELLRTPFCISARRLDRVLNALPDDSEISLKLKAGRCIISAGGTRYEMLTLPAADFVPIAIANKDSSAGQISATCEALIAGLRFCAPVMAKMDIRYYLNSMHIAATNGRITLTATDGRRLHRAIVRTDPAAPDTSTNKTHGILPRAAVARLIELADEHQEITLIFAADHITADCADQILISKLIDGKFPDAARVIPEKRPASGSVDPELFSAAVARIACVFGEREKHDRIELAITIDHITISAKNQDDERAEEIYAWNGSGKKITPITLSYSAEFLRAALDAFTTKIIHLHLPDKADECLYLTDGDSGDQVAVVTPLLG